MENKPKKPTKGDYMAVQAYAKQHGLVPDKKPKKKKHLADQFEFNVLNRQEILESVCRKNDHNMVYSSLYRCYICSVCGHSSDKEKEGYNWDDHH